MEASAWERVVLIGFMGSGKSTVGRLLARRLGWVFVDLDEAVEDEAEGEAEDRLEELEQEAEEGVTTT